MAKAVANLYPATHSGALTNAQGSQLGSALGVNATQWHETPPQVVTAGIAPRSAGIKQHRATNRAIIEAPHGLVPQHEIITGNALDPVRRFNPKSLV